MSKIPNHSNQVPVPNVANGLGAVVVEANVEPACNKPNADDDNDGQVDGGGNFENVDRAIVILSCSGGGVSSSVSISFHFEISSLMSSTISSVRSLISSIKMITCEKTLVRYSSPG